MSVLNVALNLSLNLVWVPGWLTPSFNDGSYFQWDGTTAPTNAVWYGSFDSTGANMPSKYYSVQVVADGAKWTWQFVYCNLTFSMPAGTVTLLQLMTAVYQNTQRVITADQYQQITGKVWAPTAGKVLTLATAMVDNQAQYGQPISFQGLGIIAPGVLLVEV